MGGEEKRRKEKRGEEKRGEGRGYDLRVTSEESEEMRG